jgi:hypothetical protein
VSAIERAAAIGADVLTAAEVAAELGVSETEVMETYRRLGGVGVMLLPRAKLAIWGRRLEAHRELGIAAAEPAMARTAVHPIPTPSRLIPQPKEAGVTLNLTADEIAAKMRRDREEQHRRDVENWMSVEDVVRAVGKPAEWVFEQMERSAKDAPPTMMEPAGGEGRMGVDRRKLDEWRRAAKPKITDGKTPYERDAIARKHYGIQSRHRSPYQDLSSPYSFVRDSILVLRDQDAAQRLEQHNRYLREHAEERAVTSASLGAVVPGASGLPLWASEAFAAAARSAAPLYMALDRPPLPPQGMEVPIAKVTVGATVEVQATENTLLTGSSVLAIPVDLEPVSTIAEYADVSLQALQRGGATVDAQVASDFGKAWGTKIEGELFAGTGTSGRIRGLNSASWGSTVTVAGQTIANQISSLQNAYQEAAVALGMPPDILVLASRRLAWLRANFTTLALEQEFPGVTIVQSPQASTNLGAGTNEDWCFWVNSAAAPLFTNGPEITWHGEATITAITARVVIFSLAAFATARRPEGLAVVKGITTPAF